MPSVGLEHSSLWGSQNKAGGGGDVGGVGVGVGDRGGGGGKAGNL